jgi:hypothetical protein
MKNDAIQRSVRARRYTRAAGDAPNIGKIARAPGTGLSKGERRKRRRGDRHRRSARGRIINTQLAWWLLVFALVAIALGLILWYW